MFLILYFILIFLGLISYKFKFKHFDLLVIIFLIALVCIKIDIPDWNNYNTIYNYIGSGHYYDDTGIGWYYLCKVFSSLGISFRIFKTIIFGCSLLLIRHFLNFYFKESLDKRKFWGFYLIFPALLDCIQFRFLLAMAIFMVIIKLYSSETKLGKLFSLLLFFICISIHSSFVFFVLFLLVKNKSNKRTISNLAIFFVFIIMFVIALDKNLIVSIASNFINTNRIERYFIESKSAGVIGFIIYSILLIINYLITKNICNSFNNKKFIVIKNLNYLSLLIIPFLLFDVNFIRLARPIWLLNVILYVSAGGNVENKVRIFKIQFNYKYLTIFLCVIENVIFFSGVSFNEFINMMI